MKLRTKTMLAVVLTLAALVAVLYFALSAILWGGIDQAERQNVQADTARVATAYRSEVAAVKTLVKQWAYWNDSYAFVLNRNTAYVHSNLNAGSLALLQMNAVVFLNTSDRVVYSTGYDATKGALAPLPASVLAQLRPGSPLLSFHSLTQNNSGTIVLPGGKLLLVDAAQILTSNITGPAHGVLVFGRYMNSAMIAQFKSLSQLPVSAIAFQSARTNPEFARAAVALAHGGTFFSLPLNASSIAGFTATPDIYGHPGVIFRITVPRSIHQVGETSLRLLLLALLAAGAVFVLLTLILLERLVLARIARLGTGVRLVRSRDDLSQRLDLPGTDELSGLAGDINRMLADLEDSMHREQQLKQQVTELKIEIDEARKSREVSRIVDSDYFQDIQRRAAEMRAARSTERKGAG